MNARSFDPALFDLVDAGNGLDDVVLEDISFVESCTICGAADLVFEDGRLVNMDGETHTCPEEAA